MARKKKGKGRKRKLKDEVPADSRSQVPEGDCISSQPREELWSKLLEDVAADIRCRLPWLHAVRVQLVCRGWRDLVANHYLPKHAISGDLLTPIRFRIPKFNAPELMQWCAWDKCRRGIAFPAIRGKSFGANCLRMLQRIFSVGCHGFMRLGQVPEGDCISSQPREELWSKLPEDVAADILCRLPWLHAVRVQLVCRGWRDLVANHYLPEHAVSGDLLTPIRFRMPNFNAPELMQWCAWDSAAASWRCLPPLNFLGPICKGPIWMRASHKGLVLGQTCEAHIWSYFVCNPLTKMFRALPSLPGFVSEPHAWHLQVDADGKAYSVLAVAVTSNGGPPELLKYDSRLSACSWALVHAGIARSKADPFRTESSVLVTHGLLYVTTSGYWNTRQDVMELNMRTGVWRRACCLSPMRITGAVRLWGDRIMVFTVDEVAKQICVHSFLPGASEVVVESRSGAQFQDWVEKCVLPGRAVAEWDGRIGILCLLSHSSK